MVFSGIADAVGVRRSTAMMLSRILVGVGALNWGLSRGLQLFGMEGFNLVDALLGTGQLAAFVYLLVGLAGLDIVADLLDLY